MKCCCLRHYYETSTADSESPALPVIRRPLWGHEACVTIVCLYLPPLVFPPGFCTHLVLGCPPTMPLNMSQNLRNALFAQEKAPAGRQLLAKSKYFSKPTDFKNCLHFSISKIEFSK